MIKTCKKCGKEFEAKHGNRKLCDTCKYPDKHIKVCKDCGKTFYSESGRHKYCSECKRIKENSYHRQYKEEHAEEIRASRKKYYEKNKEVLYAKEKAWRAKNKEYCNAYYKAWRKGKLDTFEYRRQSPEVLPHCKYDCFNCEFEDCKY